MKFVFVALAARTSNNTMKHTRFLFCVALLSGALLVPALAPARFDVARTAFADDAKSEIPTLTGTDFTALTNGLRTTGEAQTDDVIYHVVAWSKRDDFPAADRFVLASKGRVWEDNRQEFHQDSADVRINPSFVEFSTQGRQNGGAQFDWAPMLAAEAKSAGTFKLSGQLELVGPKGAAGDNSMRWAVVRVAGSKVTPIDSGYGSNEDVVDFGANAKLQKIELQKGEWLGVSAWRSAFNEWASVQMKSFALERTGDAGAQTKARPIVAKSPLEATMVAIPATAVAATAPGEMAKTGEIPEIGANDFGAVTGGIRKTGEVQSDDAIYRVAAWSKRDNFPAVDLVVAPNKGRVWEDNRQEFNQGSADVRVNSSFVEFSTQGRQNDGEGYNWAPMLTAEAKKAGAYKLTGKLELVGPQGAMGDNSMRWAVVRMSGRSVTTLDSGFGSNEDEVDFSKNEKLQKIDLQKGEWIGVTGWRASYNEWASVQMKSFGVQRVGDISAEGGKRPVPAQNPIEATAKLLAAAKPGAGVTPSVPVDANFNDVVRALAATGEVKSDLGTTTVMYGSKRDDFPNLRKIEPIQKGGVRGDGLQLFGVGSSEMRVGNGKMEFGVQGRKNEGDEFDPAPMLVFAPVAAGTYKIQGKFQLDNENPDEKGITWAVVTLDKNNKVTVVKQGSGAKNEVVDFSAIPELQKIAVKADEKIAVIAYKTTMFGWGGAYLTEFQIGKS